MDNTFKERLKKLASYRTNESRYTRPVVTKPRATRHDVDDRPPSVINEATTIRTLTDFLKSISGDDIIGQHVYGGQRRPSDGANSTRDGQISESEYYGGVVLDKAAMKRFAAVAKMAGEKMPKHDGIIKEGDSDDVSAEIDNVSFSDAKEPTANQGNEPQQDQPQTQTQSRPHQQSDQHGTNGEDGSAKKKGSILRNVMAAVNKLSNYVDWNSDTEKKVKYLAKKISDSFGDVSVEKNPLRPMVILLAAVDKIEDQTIKSVIISAYMKHLANDQNIINFANAILEGDDAYDVINPEGEDSDGELGNDTGGKPADKGSEPTGGGDSGVGEVNDDEVVK